MFYLQFLLFSFVVLVSVAWDATYQTQSHYTCETIKVPLCLGNSSKYNRAMLPNSLGHTEQNTIRTFTEQKELQDLIRTQCSKDLVFLICATLLPICIQKSDSASSNTKYGLPKVPPCRDLCVKVSKDCRSAIKKVNFRLPTDLNCSTLPDHATGMCIHPRHISTVKPVEKLKASCEHNACKTHFSKPKKRYDYVFRARLQVLGSGSKKKIRFSVQKFFKPDNKRHAEKTYILIKNCKCLTKTMVNQTLYLVMANKVKGDLKIVKIIKWQKSFSKLLRRKSTTGHKRRSRVNNKG